MTQIKKKKKNIKISNFDNNAEKGILSYSILIIFLEVSLATWAKFKCNSL